MMWQPYLATVFEYEHFLSSTLLIFIIASPEVNELGSCKSFLFLTNTKGSLQTK